MTARDPSAVSDEVTATSMTLRQLRDLFLSTNDVNVVRAVVVATYQPSAFGLIQPEPSTFERANALKVCAAAWNARTGGAK